MRSLVCDQSGVPHDGWWTHPPSPNAPPLTSPFFTLKGGEIYRSNDVLELVRRWAVMIDLPPLEFWSRAFRVAGATDLRDKVGEAVSKKLIKDRGRWDSEIGEIYSRPLLQPQLEASIAVGTASGVGFEDHLSGTGFAQPATR